MIRPRQNTRLIAAILAMTLASVVAASADTIYSTGSTLSSPPLPSQSNLTRSNDMGRNVIADDFMLTADATWTDVHFWTFEGTTSLVGSLDYYLFTSAPTSFTGFGSPSAWGTVALTSSNRQLAGTQSFSGTSYNLYYYSFDLVTPVSLGAGTSYWLGLHLGSGTGVINKSWVVFDSAAAGGYYYYNLGTGSWAYTDPLNQNPATAFELTATNVPEPASLLLLGTGLLGAVRAARKRR